MKREKLVAIAGALVLTGSSLWAYDATANIMMKGSLVSVEKDGSGNTTTDILTNNPVNQIDNPGDGIEIDFNAGIAGAHLGLWYKTATDGSSDSNEKDDWEACFRRTYLWFAPIDAVKIRLGYVGDDTFFKERIDQWKVGSPFSISGRDWVNHPGYINCNDAEGWGFGINVRPIDQLVFNAGITPAKKGGYMAKAVPGIRLSSDSDDVLVAPWGAGVKYYWNNFEFQASYRCGVKGASTDTATYKETWSVARLGAGYSDSNVYAFFQPILGLDYNTTKEKIEATGLCFDIYGEYFLDAWTFMLHAPVTLRFTGEEGDANYMEWVAVAKYNLGSFGNVDDLSPYVKAGSAWDDVNIAPKYRMWRLDNSFSDYFNMSFMAGVGFKVANCIVDTGVQYDMYSTKYKTNNDVEWNVSVPFSVKISF